MKNKTPQSAPIPSTSQTPGGDQPASGENPSPGLDRAGRDLRKIVDDIREAKELGEEIVDLDKQGTSTSS